MQEEMLKGYRLSPQQRQLWEALRHGWNRSYQAKCAVAVKGRLSARRLKDAVQRTIARHEILRTTFQCLPGMTIPMQVIQETGRMVWREDDLSGLDEPAPAVEAWYQELSPSFDFERGPLLYLNLIKRAEEDYVLIVCLPSICADSTGLRNLIAEFSRSYAASGSEAESLGEVAQYADLAEWQNELIESEELRSGREYWRDRERPRQPSPQLAIEDRPAGEPPFNPHCRELLLGPALTDRIESLARRVESTSEAILLALWDLLLRRQTGDPELDIGAIFDGRHVAEIEEALGLFAKCLPLDCRPEDGLPFKVFVKRIEASCLAARNWQEYFSWDQLAPSNGPVSEAALLPYCFEPPTEPAGFKTSDLSFTIFKQQACIDRFKIKLAASRGSNGLTMEFHYDSELFRPADIQVLMGHYRALLESALADPEAPLRELEMLTTVERRQLVTEYNSTRTAWPSEKLVPELFAEQVALTPEAVAVIYGDERLTYSELNQRADRLANYLRESGVGPETVVGLCLERSLDLVVGLLAILKAGGAYLPLDPSHPPARLDFMLADASVRLLLTHSELRSKLPPTAQVACFEIDAQWESLDRAPERPGELRLAPDNLAYVIYTSGSTGQPKGVMLSHGSLKNYLLWAIAHYPVNAGCGAPVHSSLGFDLTITSLFTPLLVGGYAHLMTVEREIEALGEALSSGPGYSLIKLTPAHLRLLSGMFEDFGLEGAARSMVIGGENLTAQAVQWWRERAPGVRLFNEYGPTEGTVGCCVYEVATRPDVERGRPHVPIGRPIANASLYVLDRRGAPAPQGLVGELCLGGAGLARGYLNRPELTAEKFLPSPDAGEPGGRLYRTGDLARYLRDGHLECLGRVDEQVKIRGYRIELGEIETRLADHPAIGEAAVMARETASGDKSLVAYYTSAESAAPSPPPTAEDLRAHLAATLPEYMLPVAYVKLPALPLTSNGKLDRQSLPAPDRAASPSREYRPPVGEIEIALAGIWEQLLQVERVGRDDNFFALGGHSLMAVTLIERMRQAGLSGEVRALFMQPTLAALAATVNDTLAPVAVAPNRIPPACTAITLEMLPLIQLSALDLERIVSTVPGGAANVQDLYPLAPLQEGILFHHLLGNAGDLYLMRALLSFETRSRLDRYLRALQAVIERHDILRTSILWEGLPEPVQVVWREAPLTVEEIAVDPTAGDAAAQLMARYDPASYRIDISVAPLMRVGIAHDARTGRWLMLHLYHHLSIDHTTVEVLLEEVQAHLLGRAEQLPAPLPFRNVVAQTRQRENRAGHEEFFRTLLGDVDEPTAPFGLTDIQGHGSSLRDGRLEVDPQLAVRLRRAAQSLGVSPAILYHLVWALVLARVSGRDDVVFGTVLFGRMQGREGIDRMVGIFINTLPVRIQINADSLKESLYRIQGLLIGLLRHEHAPLTLAQRCSAVAAPAPLFSALLNYRHRGAAGPRVDSAEAPLPAWEGIEFLSTEERSNYPFCLNVNDLGEGFVLHAQVASPADPDRICAYLHTALERLAEGLEQAPSTPVRNLNVLPDSERHQILVAWNATGADYPRDLCLNRLIEAQADRYRDRTAISYEEEALTYGELNARANQLAHHLKKLGVGPEVLVGLYLERSIEMVVGWLGTLKAGGAYLPLDPSYPPDRISFMLEDGRSAVILTQARLLPFLPANQAEVLCLDRDWNLIGRESRENPESEVSPAHPAYVIYTSGSTGRPKGVVIPHGAITNHMLWMQEAFPLEARDRVVQKTPFSFDASVWEFYAPLLVGGELIMARPGGHQDSAYLVRLMAEREATILQVVPSMLQLLLNESGIETCRGLKRVFCGGEALTLELQTRFRSRLGAE
ncbi:MAG TPA: amino acid adenylation domain-containing protein, partial [Blastocatellia bacterium]|nr:amino acid adenylation domain-containing protein [Blastocatellia bacterium]